MVEVGAVAVGGPVLLVAPEGALDGRVGDVAGVGVGAAVVGTDGGIAGSTCVDVGDAPVGVSADGASRDVATARVACPITTSGVAGSPSSSTSASSRTAARPSASTASRMMASIG